MDLTTKETVEEFLKEIRPALPEDMSASANVGPNGELVVNFLLKPTTPTMRTVDAQLGAFAKARADVCNIKERFLKEHKLTKAFTKRHLKIFGVVFGIGLVAEITYRILRAMRA